MGFQVAAVAPSPCARSSAASSSPSTSALPPHGILGGGLTRSRSPVNWGAGVLVRRRTARAPARCTLSASLDGMGAGDAEFLRRIEELAAAAGVQPAGATGCGWPASVERSASSVGLPLSLRMLKRKKQQQQQREVRQQVAPRWDERLLGSAGESVGRAFSSMVLIVRELQSFALQQMCDDLTGVLARVQGEMHASFVWLFQHIFAGTPALMLSLMLLLANFTVQSMGDSVAAASNRRRLGARHQARRAVAPAVGGGFREDVLRWPDGIGRREQRRWRQGAARRWRHRRRPVGRDPLSSKPRGAGAAVGARRDYWCRGGHPRRLSRRAGPLGDDGLGGFGDAGQLARGGAERPGRAGQPRRARGGGAGDRGPRGARADDAEVRAGRLRGAGQLADPLQLRAVPVPRAERPRPGGPLLRACCARGAGGRGGAEPVRDVPVEGAGRPRRRRGDVPGGHRGRPRQLAPRRRVRALPLEHRR